VQFDADPTLRQLKSCLALRVRFGTLAPARRSRSISVLLYPALAFGPFRMREQPRLEGSAILPQAPAVRAAVVVGIVKLHGVVLPAADATNLVRSGRLLVKRDEPAARTRKLTARRVARIDEEPIRNPHRANLRQGAMRSGDIPERWRSRLKRRPIG
jgi:hypothetical protein